MFIPYWLFEKSNIQNFRGLAPFVMALECAKIRSLGQTTQNTVQNFELLRFWRGKLHLDRWNMQTSQSFLNILLEAKRKNRYSQGGYLNP